MDGYKRRGGLLLAILLVLSVPATARAHSAIEGLEGFGGGLLHPLTSPAHLLVIISLGLLTGQRKPLDLKTLFAVFAPCLALALLLTMTGAIKSVYQPMLVVLASVCRHGGGAGNAHPSAGFSRAFCCRSLRHRIRFRPRKRLRGRRHQDVAGNVAHGHLPAL